MSIQWKGVMPATLTQFNADLTIDHGLMAEHGKWLIENGCTAIVAHGSLGEGATLSFEEKVALQKTYVAAVPNTPIIPGIAALSTKEAVDLAKAAKDNGCRGLMVLPPYLYSSDWREMKAHMKAVISATDLPCIIYNNPVAYKTDFIPAQIKELADELSERRSRQGILHRRAPRRRHPRSFAATASTLGVGVDDCALEGFAMGAKFWITGVGDAFPGLQRETARTRHQPAASRKPCRSITGCCRCCAWTPSSSSCSSSNSSRTSPPAANSATTASARRASNSSEPNSPKPPPSSKKPSRPLRHSD